MSLSRDYERQLLNLCASRSLDPARWEQLGPRFFMAGLAVMLAGTPDFDRRSLLNLAEELHPGASVPAVFGDIVRVQGSIEVATRILADLEKHTAKRR